MPRLQNDHEPGLLPSSRSVDRMKRLASRLTCWHKLHESTPRSTPQRREASQGPYWHRRAHEGSQIYVLAEGVRWSSSASAPSPGASPPMGIECLGLPSRAATDRLQQWDARPLTLDEPV